MLNAHGILDHLDKVIPEPKVLVAKDLFLPNDSLADNLEGSLLKVTLKFDTSISKLVACSSEMHHDKWHANEATVKRCIVSSIPDLVATG